MPSLSVGGVRHVASVDSITRSPARVLFWRSRCQTAALHRNPLLSPSIGIGLRSFAVDPLHTLNLGLYLKFIARAFWVLLRADAWNVSGAFAPRAGAEELIANGILHLRAELQTWYPTHEHAIGTPVTRVEDLTVKHLGEERSQHFKCKAAAARPLVAFAVYLLGKYTDKLPPGLVTLRLAGEALLRVIELLRTCPRNQPAAITQALHDNLKAHLTLATKAGVDPIPKAHLAMHMIARTRCRGKHNTASSERLCCPRAAMGFATEGVSSSGVAAAA